MPADVTIATWTAPAGAKVRELSRDECFAILSESSLGRIGVSSAALPQILPVNFVFESGSIVFRANEGGLLHRTCRSAVVAFEIDDYDSLTGLGWSVLTVGVADVLRADGTLWEVQRGLMGAAAVDGVFVKIAPGTISGRAIEPVTRLAG